LFRYFKYHVVQLRNDLVSHLRQTSNGVFITNGIPDILCILFADEVACGADTVDNLQLQLNAISDYCIQTEMTVNLKRRKLLYLETVDHFEIQKNGLLKAYMLK